MMNRMITANLAHRPIRSLISVSAIALEVTMILLIVALFYGQLNGSKGSQMGIGADVMVQPPGSLFVGVTGSPIPVKVGDILRKLPHVNVAAPVIWTMITSPSIEIIYGIDLATYEGLGSPFQYISGGPFQGPHDVIIDDYFAGMQRVKVGDSITILNHDFHVCGIVAHGKGARKFLPLSTMQDLTGAENHVSVFYLKLDDPRNADEVVKEVSQVPGMQNYAVRSMTDYLSMMTPERIPGFQTSIRVVIGVAVTIGFLVIFQSMYTAVAERTREIGVLKSLGASKFYIVDAVLRETALLAILGVIVGVLISMATRRIILYERPVLHLYWSGDWVIRAAAIAIMGALGGAVYPAFKAAQKDPIDALAYE